MPIRSEMHAFRAEGQPIGTPTTSVLARELTRDAVLGGSRTGRVAMSRDPIGPRLELRARASDGHRAAIGDELAIDPRGPLEVDWRIVGGRGMTARVVSVRGPELADAIESGDAQRTVRVDPPDGGRPLRDHLRLDVVAADGTLTELTNPIHLGPVSR